MEVEARAVTEPEPEPVKQPRDPGDGEQKGGEGIIFHYDYKFY